MSSGFRGGEVHLALAQMLAGGEGDAALPLVVHGTIEVIHYALMVDYTTLVCEHLVVGLGRNYQVLTHPVVPVDEVVTGCKGVVGIVFAGGIIG